MNSRPISETKPKYAYIDCLRGYAILLVITTHLSDRYPDLPYPVHRVVVLGWHGVQLFFLASCVTLMMSWNHEASRNGAADARAFFIRRFFRIAPAYYAAALFYFWLSPPPGGFDAWQLLAAVSFVNAWSPSLTPTIADRWVVVPGGWSIGVEFTFYFLFPLIATWVTSLPRAIGFVVASILGGLALNSIGAAAWDGMATPVELENFLYFWFPNQAVVFAVGTVLYFLIARGHLRFLARYGNVLPLVACISFAALTYANFGHRLDPSTLAVPVFLAACVPFVLFALSLSIAPRSVFVNPVAAAIGRVSFSAYLIHFAVLGLLPYRFPDTFATTANGYTAIIAFTVTWFIVVAVTYSVSWIAYRVIELPSIGVGKIFVRRLPAVSARRAPVENTL